MIKYLLIILILSITSVLIFIKLKFKFWALQPVFHIYDIHHWLSPNKIIQNKTPLINNYVNLINIQTFDIKRCPQNILKKACLFLTNNYL